MEDCQPSDCDSSVKDEVLPHCSPDLLSDESLGKDMPDGTHHGNRSMERLCYTFSGPRRDGDMDGICHEVGIQIESYDPARSREQGLLDDSLTEV